MSPDSNAQSNLQTEVGQVLVTFDAPAAAPASAGAALLGQLPLLAAIVAIFYFLVIRPQNQERKRHEGLVNGLKRDDEIVTQSGMYGRVTQVQGGRVELEIAPKVRVWVEAASVKRKAEPAAAEAPDAGKGTTP